MTREDQKLLCFCHLDQLYELLMRLEMPKLMRLVNEMAKELERD